MNDSLAVFRSQNFDTTVILEPGVWKLPWYFNCSVRICQYFIRFFKYKNYSFGNVLTMRPLRNGVS